MIQDFYGSGLNLCTDNWYTSVELAAKLFSNQITLLGTLKISTINRYMTPLLEKNGLKILTKNKKTGFERNVIIYSSPLGNKSQNSLFFMVYNEKASKKSTLFLTSDCNMFNSGSIEFITRGKFVKNNCIHKH